MVPDEGQPLSVSGTELRVPPDVLLAEWLRLEAGHPLSQMGFIQPPSQWEVDTLRTQQTGRREFIGG